MLCKAPTWFIGLGALCAAVGTASAQTPPAQPTPANPPTAASPPPSAAPTSQEVPPPVPEVEPRGTAEAPSSTEAQPPGPESQPPATGTQNEPPTNSPQHGSQESATGDTAHAQSPAEKISLEPPDEPVNADPPGVREHDGFFLRASTGFSAWSELLASDESEIYGGEVRGRSTGIATTGGLTIGGDVGGGMVLAATFINVDLEASTFRLTDESAAAPPPELDPGLRQMFSLGPQLIWYPNVKGGFNAGAGLGIAVLTPRDASIANRDDEERYGAAGLSINVDIGQQFWIGEQWSAGVRGRILGAVLGGKDQDDVTWFHGVAASPSVVFDVVFH